MSSLSPTTGAVKRGQIPMTANEIDGEFGHKTQAYTASWPELIRVTRSRTNTYAARSLLAGRGMDLGDVTSRERDERRLSTVHRVRVGQDGGTRGLCLG
jgi:hypothetical protein